MPPEANPRNRRCRWLRSAFRRLFSSSGAREDGSGRRTAQQLEEVVSDPSLPDRLAATSCAEDSQMSATVAEGAKSRARASDGSPFSLRLGPTLPTTQVGSPPSASGQWKCSERNNGEGPSEQVRSSMGPSFTSTFSKAHHFNVGGSIHINSPHHQSADGWSLLLENIASNAFYDSGARFDPPKCDEDTRVEVIGEIMDWINDKENPRRLLCMTGAAGAGKSALQQTISERCASTKTLAVAFFFSSQDPTRNNLSRIIPTIAFQLGQKNAALREYISKAVEDDPPIFDRTIRAQMDILVVRPFKQLCDNGVLDYGSFPHAILIDGLDECYGEEKQEDLLCTIKDCLLDNDLPFRVFIASRPEWAIRSALDPESYGYLHPISYHIQLSDKYDATEDIRRFLWRRLQAIGGRSRDPRAKSRSWPAAADIERLVRAASGQFVYAATVVKYVSERRSSSPVDRLQTVIDWTPEEGQFARPFEALDTLYSAILSAAKESYEAVDTNRHRNFLLLLRAHHINSDSRVGWVWSADSFDEMLNLERGLHEVLLSDLHSLVVYQTSTSFVGMHFYHRSFSEFLDSKSRAKDLFIPEIQVKTYILNVVVQGIVHLPIKSVGSTLSTFKSSWPYATKPLEKETLKFLTLYSKQGEILSDSQILALARNRTYGQFDPLVSSLNRFSAHEIDQKFLKMISVIMHRLKNELNEPGLADAWTPYYNRWREYFRTHRE